MNESPRDSSMNRREFLSRTLRAGVLAAAAGSLSYWLYDGRGPGPDSTAQGNLVVLPDFSVPELSGRMSVITGADRIRTVDMGLKAVGGIEAFIRKGDGVLIKVNAAFASPPILGATTNPQLVSHVATLCRKAGASSVVVTDNPINDPQSCFTLSGIGDAARSAGARLMLPTGSSFAPTTVPHGKLIRDWPLLHAPFQGVNKVIGIAPVKDHHRSGASMIMKNWYGLLGGQRNIFHQNINDIILELAMMVKPTLVILDGTTSMMTNGPTGGSLSDLKQTRCMIVSTDQVAADACGASLLGKRAADLPFILKAQNAGLGTADYESLNPAREAVG
ncbi:DUF362 domain-containing protein [Desulfoferrobacter suflitae]|uniref:DUF362 domain-containing protein n=1 Tax=Desulfoferrobacter suflitae TaxID=2865782 RepID=UPI0021644959|nr:DUF362 domain-containing protein [Desulfoferrobacter suflitae]MCK8600847.1 DUF362 domain-containing protein [Desulfoferrobacter suflitae]